MRQPADNRGQSLVEFALVIPIVLLLMVGLFDLGRIVFVSNSLSDGAKHGARNGSVDPRAADYCSVVDDAVESAIRGQALSTYTVTYVTVATTGTETGTYVLCINGANGPDKASVPLTAGPGDRVRVNLASNVELALEFIARATGQTSFDLQAESTMQVTFAPLN